MKDSKVRDAYHTEFVREIRNAYKILIGKSSGRNTLKGLLVDQIIILKYIYYRNRWENVESHIKHHVL
jgi:hypothetical protein